MTGVIVALCAAVLVLAGGCGPLQGWLVPATQKVYPDSMPPEKGTAVEICAARGEYEAVQLALRADVDISEVRVGLSEVDGGKSRPLSPRWVEMFEERYVPTPADKLHPVTPDPLVPMKVREGYASLSLKAGVTKAVWVRVKIPEGARPGVYAAELGAGSFEVPGKTAGTGEMAFVELPLKVTVWPFALPRKTHARTAFGISGEWIALQHGVKVGTPEYDELYRKYYDELLAHRICAYGVPYGVMDPRADRYLRSERVNSFTLPYTESEAELAKVWEHVRAVGAGAKAWVYPSDEPVGKPQYDGLKKQCAAVHRAAPGLKVCSPFFRGPDWNDKLTPFDELVGCLDIWCCNTGYYNNKNVQGLMRERQKVGEEVWWYVCCGPGSPFGNYFVNMSAIQHRILTWQMYHYGITGLLYWSTTWWNPPSTKDPYEDIATVKDINPNIYGDGSLFYPGKKVGVDGPVTSIRLECARDSLEDYEYLIMAQRALGEKRTEEIVGQVVTDLIQYEVDPTAFEANRRALGNELAKAR
jgi:hypothetical protein